MKFNRHSFTVIILAAILALAGAGCKSRKKTAEMNAAAAEKARLEQEAKVKAQQQADQKAKEEADAKARRDAEARAREAKESTPGVKLAQYFDAISSSPSAASANSSIGEALAMFESPDTPVLIIISQEGNDKDYDKPTTIKKYLNYLKDQKKNINKVETFEVNGAGKITSLELKKN